MYIGALSDNEDRTNFDTLIKIISDEGSWIFILFIST